ncbi:MAG TPA: prolyl oligopeptidase family serine peptidase [Bryobacteraceae bacterium]|jgi:dipeptidyl-peptidase-4
MKLLLIAAAAAALASAERLDIDRLYRLPWVIGTAPKDVAWSPDSKSIAFLWNDEGTNFRDVWMAARGQAKPVRVTRMPRPQVSAHIANDLAAMKQAAFAEIDPGVSHVLWTADASRIMFLWQGKLYAVAPGGQPELLTSQANVTAVSAASKGNRIAFQAGSNLFLAIVNASGLATDVKRVGQVPLSAEEMFWSHDGRSLAFIETDESQIPMRGIPDYMTPETTLRMVKRALPGEPSERRWVTWVTSRDEARVHRAELGNDPFDIVFGVAWSPDDKTLLVDKSDLYIKDRRLMLVDPTTGKAKLLLRETDPANVTEEWWADWAPDGHGVYFTSDRESFYQVYYAPLDGGAVHRVTSNRGEIFSASLNAPSNALFYLSNEGRPEELHLHRVTLNDRTDVEVTRAPGTHTPVVAPDGSIVADSFSNDLTPPDLYFQDVSATSSPLQITHSPLKEFEQYHWVAPRYVTFASTVDNVTLHGRLTLPPDFDPHKKYPAILGSVYSNTVRNQWGGRVAHPTWGLDQYLAQQGYVLLNVDIRGSMGYGKAFRQKLALDYGGVDVEDLYSGVKFLGTLGYVDMARVGMWGSSYGGLLTTTSLFTKPGVYKAGIAGAPATSLFHALTGEMRTMMAPQDHQKEYTRASAFLKSGGLADHLMFIHGMRDEIVLFKDTMTLTERLILQGKDVQTVVLPDAPHSWDTGPMAQTRFAYHQLISFFARYLGEGPTRP